MSEERDTPGVLMPPPLIFLCGMILGGLVDWGFPAPVAESRTVPAVLGSVPVVAGLVVIFLAWIGMRRAKTNIEPWHPTTAIVDSGVFAVSRNPVYASMVLIYLGAALALNSWWFLPFLPLVLLVLRLGVIDREERYLERKFGEEYLAYKSRVRRWI